MSLSEPGEAGLQLVFGSFDDAPLDELNARLQEDADNKLKNKGIPISEYQIDEEAWMDLLDAMDLGAKSGKLDKVTLKIGAATTKMQVDSDNRELVLAFGFSNPLRSTRSSAAKEAKTAGRRLTGVSSPDAREYVKQYRQYEVGQRVSLALRQSMIADLYVASEVLNTDEYVSTGTPESALTLPQRLKGGLNFIAGASVMGGTGFKGIEFLTGSQIMSAVFTGAYIFLGGHTMRNRSREKSMKKHPEYELRQEAIKFAKQVFEDEPSEDSEDLSEVRELAEAALEVEINHSSPFWGSVPKELHVAK